VWWWKNSCSGFHRRHKARKASGHVHRPPPRKMAARHDSARRYVTPENQRAGGA
jgi:hypothetical protein